MKEDNGFDLLTLNYYKTLKKPEPGNLSSVGVEKLSPQSEFQICPHILQNKSKLSGGRWQHDARP